MTAREQAWHFCAATMRDGRPIPPAGPVPICLWRRPSDALKYARGPILCRVECTDGVTERSDELVCPRWRSVTRSDATELMCYYARMQALSVIHLYDDPSDVLLDYLMTGDENIRVVAWYAAWNVAGARAAALDVALDIESARVAVRAATWHASMAAASAMAAAKAAACARAAACDVALDVALAEFDALVYECFGVQS